MAVTVRELAALAELGLVPVAGLAGLDEQVTWVHGSEIEDPTPWLGGGELLLTTGMRLTEPGELAALCARMAAAGAAGIGFATGVAFDEVPVELSAAADEHGLAVLEVPYETPFVAIAKTVAQALAEHQHAALRNALNSHRSLVHAALGGGGVPSVATKLAELLDGWSLVTDPAMRVTAAEPGTAADHLATVSADLERLHRGEVHSVGIAQPGFHVVMHKLGGGGRSRGFLVAGREAAFGPPEQTVIAAAVSLLGLMLEQFNAAEVRARRQRNELLVQLLHDSLAPDVASREIRDLGLDPDDLRVLVVQTPPETDMGTMVEEIQQELDERGVTAVAAHEDDLAVVLTGETDAAAAVLSRARSERPAVGVSAPASAGRLDVARRQALQAARIGGGEGNAVTYADRLDAMTMLVSLQDSGVLDLLVSRVLGPLDGEDVLLESLRAYLDNHGSWHAAATALGVHRHTLRARLDRVQRILDRQLDSPYARLELGLALHARDLLGR